MDPLPHCPGTGKALVPSPSARHRLISDRARLGWDQPSSPSPAQPFPFPSHPRGGQARPGSGAADGDVDTLERAREPPCLGLCASPHQQHRQPLEPGTALAPRDPAGRQAPFPAGTSPSRGAQQHQNSPGKGLKARDTLLATVSAVSPVRLEGGSVPSQLCVPAWGLPPASAAHLCPPSGPGREAKRELPRLAGKQHRNRRHARGLTLPTGKRGGGRGVSSCPGSKITLELSTCQGPAHVSPGSCSREAEGISKMVTVILGSRILSRGYLGYFLWGNIADLMTGDAPTPLARAWYLAVPPAPHPGSCRMGME